MEEIDEAGSGAKEDTKKRQLSLLRFLARDFSSAIFWEAVPDDTPGYFDIIAEPMDLRLVCDNVIADAYWKDDGESTSAVVSLAANAAFCSDVDLVFSNCKTYNKKGHIVKVSTDLGSAFQKQFQAWVVESNRPEDGNIE